MAWILPFVLLGSCDKELVEYEKVSVEIVVERGDAWLHDFPLFLGIKRKNPPQIAVWIEDAQGRYLSTVYASSKIATQSWLAAGGTAAGRRCLTGAIAGVCNMPTGFTCRRKANRWRTAYRVPRERPAGRGLCRRRRPVVGQRGVRSRAGRPQQSRRKFGRDRPRYFGAHFGAPDRGTHYDPCPMKGRSRVLAAALCVLPSLPPRCRRRSFPAFPVRRP